MFSSYTGTRRITAGLNAYKFPTSLPCASTCHTLRWNSSARGHDHKAREPKRSVGAQQHEADAEVFDYKKGDYSIIPKEHSVGGRIAVRSYLDRNRTELSNRTYLPQKAWFEPYHRPAPFARPHEQRRHHFYNLETKLIWKAFDTPELIGILLHDETIKGNRELYSEAFLDSAIYFTREARYWRCLGITKPFYDKHTLRVHCWEEGGLQVGTLVLSQAMRHALMDLERAVRRKELGLDPNYVWDRWGPIGFIDGAQMDYLPRFEHKPYLDPDGVEVTELDVLPYNTHEQIKERYGQFIYPDTTSFEGIFAAPSHGSLTLEDVPNAEAVALYKDLKTKEGVPLLLDNAAISQHDLRVLFFLSADPRWLEAAKTKLTWAEVCESLAPTLEACNEKIDAARMLQNHRHTPERVRAFYEEKCGFHDFMFTPDKTITAAVLCYLIELRRLCVELAWGADLARCLTDFERLQVMGRDAFVVYHLIEETILQKKCRLWAARFAGGGHEESTLDYLLENFGRRAERPKNVGTSGVEFDREQEPIGRQVQRRVIEIDKANKLAEVRRSRGKMWSSKKTLFDSLHRKQLQNFNYGVR